MDGASPPHSSAAAIFELDEDVIAIIGATTLAAETSFVIGLALIKGGGVPSRLMPGLEFARNEDEDKD